MTRSLIRSLILLLLVLTVLVSSTGCAGIISRAVRAVVIAENLSTSAPEESADPDVHQSGMYKVGTDIDAGLYYVWTDKMRLGFLEVTSDSSGSVDSMIGIDDFETFTFVCVNEGQYLNVTSGYFMPASRVPAIKPKNGKYGPGTYRIGLDLPAGEYQIKANSGESGYYQVSADGSVGLDSLITNDNFQTKSYVTVKDGEYLKLERCYLKFK